MNAEDPRVLLVEALWEDPRDRAVIEALIERRFPGAIAHAEKIVIGRSIERMVRALA